MTRRALSDAINSLCLIARSNWAALAEAVTQRAGGRVVAYSYRLLCCCTLLSSFCSELLDDVEVELIEGIGSIPARDAAIPIVEWNSLIVAVYPAEDHDELRRAFADVWESFGHLLCRLLPALSDHLASGLPLDSQLVSETSRELEHLKYHLEIDLIDRATVSMSWSDDSPTPM